MLGIPKKVQSLCATISGPLRCMPSLDKYGPFFTGSKILFLQLLTCLSRLNLVRIPSET